MAHIWGRQHSDGDLFLSITDTGERHVAEIALKDINNVLGGPEHVRFLEIDELQISLIHDTAYIHFYLQWN